MKGNIPNSNNTAPGIRPTRLLLFTGLFVLLTLAGMLVIHRAIAEHAFTFDRRLLAAPVVAAVLGLLLLYFLADGLRLYFTLRALGQRIPLALIFRLVFVNIFFSNVTPLASGGGFAQIWFLQREGVPLGTATAASTVRTLLAIAFIFSAAPLALLTLVPAELYTPGVSTLVTLAALLGIYAAFFFVLLFQTRWLVAPMDAVLARMRRWHFISNERHRRWRFASKREMLRFAAGFRNYLRGRRRYVFLSVFFTALFLLCLFSFPALLLWGLGYDTAYLRTVGLAALTTFVMYFSPTPGASGIAEGVFGHLFSRTVAAEHLVLVTLGWRFLTIHIGMMIGIVTTHREITRRKDT